MPYKLGKTLKSKNSKFKKLKLPLTVVNNFNCGIIKLKVDANLYGLKAGDIYFLDPKDAKKINDVEWNHIVDILKKEEEEIQNTDNNAKVKKK